MVGASRLLVALALVGLFVQPLYADVIPTRRAGESKESSQKVQSRLVDLGMTADAAKDQVSQLTAEQTKYFAGNPDRIQLVAQAENFGGQSDNLWWEWVFGIAFLAVGVGVIIIVAD